MNESRISFLGFLSFRTQMMRAYNLLAITRYFYNNCNKAQNGYKKRGFAQSFGHLQCCGSNAVKRPNAFSISSPFYDPKKSHFYEQSEEVIILHPKLTFGLPNFLQSTLVWATWPKEYRCAKIDF